MFDTLDIEITPYLPFWIFGFVALSSCNCWGHFHFRNIRILIPLGRLGSSTNRATWRTTYREGRLMLSSQRELVLEAIQNAQTATSKAVPLKNHSDPQVRDLANAVHHVAFALQQIGLALTDSGREKNLNV